MVGAEPGNASPLHGRVAAVLSEVLKIKGEERTAFASDDPLYEGGVGMDSLDAATFSVLLEREFGSDPYRAKVFPRTVGDVLAFFEAREEG